MSDLSIIGSFVGSFIAFPLTWLSYVFAKRFMIHKEVKANFSIGVLITNYFSFHLIYDIRIKSNALDTMGLPELIANCSITPIIITIICTAIGITALPPKKNKQKN